MVLLEVITLSCEQLNGNNTHALLLSACFQISKNPYLYNSHLELIKKLRVLGDLQRLRDARQAMQKHFPLSEGTCTTKQVI